MTLQNHIIFFNDVKNCTLHVSVSYNTELGEYAQVLCCSQLPFIYTQREKNMAIYCTKSEQALIVQGRYAMKDLGWSMARALYSNLKSPGNDLAKNLISTQVWSTPPWKKTSFLLDLHVQWTSMYLVCT